MAETIREGEVKGQAVIPMTTSFQRPAIQAEARFVVTGDRDLLEVKNDRGARILGPRK